MVTHMKSKHGNMSLCIQGRVPGAHVTNSPAYVTCRNCKKMMEEGYLSTRKHFKGESRKCVLKKGCKSRKRNTRKAGR